MGTLFNQRPRQESIESYARSITCIADDLWPKQKEPYTPDQIIAAAKVAEVALKLQSADVFDEQLAGFGELFKELISVLEK